VLESAPRKVIDGGVVFGGMTAIEHAVKLNSVGCLKICLECGIPTDCVIDGLWLDGIEFGTDRVL
jgi:hypothetical protein